MEKDYAFFPHFINEEIFVIKEEKGSYLKQEGLIEEAAETEEKTTPENLKAIPSEENEKEIEPEIFYKGKNLKKVAIIVDYKNKGFIAPSEEEFLLKILGAVKLSSDDVAIININHLHSGSQIKSFDFLKLLTFGCGNRDLPNAGDPLYALRQKDGKSYLKADSLSEIEMAKEKKLKLWENLQKMFIV